MIRWLARHKIFVIAIFNVVLWLLLLPTFVSTEHQLPLGIIFELLMLYLSFRLANHFRKLMRRKAVEAYHYACDPYPLEAAAREQLAYVRFASARTGLQLDLSTALHATGRNVEAVQILESLHIESIAIPTIVKLVYYNNLVAIYMNMGKLELVPELLQKQGTLLIRLRANEWTRRIYATYYRLAQAKYQVCRKEYEAAFPLLEELDIQDLYLPGAVGMSLLKARILIETDRFDAAKPHLEFVLEHGNKLHAAELARRYLAGHDFVSEV